MVRICLIEDSLDLQLTLRKQLEAWYQVTTAGSLAEARRHLAGTRFDLLLLDVMLPDGNGFEFCAQLRSEKRTQGLPIIFLTGKADPLDKMMGFTLGADDYLVKPAEPIELRARIEARIRGSLRSTENSGPDWVSGPLRFDRARQRVFLRGAADERDIGLTPIEYRLIHLLAIHPGRAFRRDELMKSIRDPGVHVRIDNIYTHVCAIRRKLGESSSLLESIPRVGYRYLPPTEPPAPP